MPFPSPPQQQLYQLVKQIHPNATEEYPAPPYRIDIAVIRNGIKLAIEYDGVSWHDAQRDAIRDAALKAQGWRIIRIRAADLAYLKANPWFLQQLLRL